jgi:GT2 family glycosyltransferase
LPWLEDKTYAGVRAHLVEDGGKANSSVYIRWRARHITREGKDFSVSPNSPLITSAAILRKSTVLDLGNYNSHMTHSEDRDLSERLEKAGYHIGFDPALWVKYIGEENLGKLLDRYWRWTSCDNLEFTFLDYIKNFNYVVKHMCSKDIKDHDPCSCLISLLSPHYLYWRTKFEKLRHKEAAN